MNDPAKFGTESPNYQSSPIIKVAPFLALYGDFLILLYYKCKIIIKIYAIRKLTVQRTFCFLQKENRTSGSW